MKDVGQAIRKAYYDALLNQVTEPGAPLVKVPIVDEKLELAITDADLYMLIGAQNETPADNKTKWVSEVELTITIVNRRKATNSKTVVENIADQMLTILFPVKNSNTLVLSSPFSLTYARVVTPIQYAFERTNDGWKIIKELTFKNRITQ